jgi:hypothetical protein
MAASRRCRDNTLEPRNWNLFMILLAEIIILHITTTLPSVAAAFWWMLSGLGDADYATLGQHSAALGLGMGAGFASGFGATSPETWERQHNHNHDDDDENDD